MSKAEEWLNNGDLLELKEEVVLEDAKPLDTMIDDQIMFNQKRFEKL